MKSLLLILFCGTFVIYICQGCEDYLQNPLYSCIQCLCHARSGCWLRRNCARYSIPKAYWEAAGSLSVDNDDTFNSAYSYKKCMKDENCIVGTIIRYTEKFGKLDCNCDGKFDCKDRFAIHLFGSDCKNPKYSSTYARRFNDCSARIGVANMLSEEGFSSCDAPPLV